MYRLSLRSVAGGFLSHQERAISPRFWYQEYTKAPLRSLEPQQSSDLHIIQPPICVDLPLLAPIEHLLEQNQRHRCVPQIRFGFAGLG